MDNIMLNNETITRHQNEAEEEEKWKKRKSVFNYFSWQDKKNY